MEKNLDNWIALKNEILNLKKNYSTGCEPVLSQIRFIISNASSDNNVTISAILSIIYECSLREIIKRSFPFSAYLMEKLTAESNEVELFRPIINGHIKQLQKVLENSDEISFENVGVLAMLLCIYKLSRLTSQDISATSTILEKMIKDTQLYIQVKRTSKNEKYTDLFVLLLFCIQWYAIQNGGGNDDKSEKLIFYLRNILSSNSSLTTLGRVLILDIIEHTCKPESNIEIYQAIYSKYLQESGSHLLSELNDFLCKIPYPKEANEDTVDDVFNGNIASQDQKNTNGKIHRIPSIGTVIKSVREDQHTQINGDVKEPLEAWSESISGEINTLPLPEDDDDDDVCESIKIPERCVSRVFGLEGAIKRKIELDSSAKVIVTRREDPDRPETSPLTAHRLITGALGMNKPMAEEKAAVEKQKLINARVKRQNERNIEPVREIIIEGLSENVQKAKDIINDIITKVETVVFPLDITVDELLDRYDSKLKTIESLLNVYLEIEEQEDDTVVIKLSGDGESCKDGKKLILDEIYALKTQTGRFFTLPKELQACFKNIEEIRQFMKLIGKISAANVKYLMENDAGYVFVCGLQSHISKALDIFHKTNIELICSLTESNDNFTSQELCEYVQNRFDSYNGDWRVQIPSLRRNLSSEAIKSKAPPSPAKRRYYSRESLIKLRRCPVALEFPEALDYLIMEEPFVFKNIIFPEGLPERVIDEIIISLSSPMLSTYDVY